MNTDLSGLTDTDLNVLAQQCAHAGERLRDGHPGTARFLALLSMECELETVRRKQLLQHVDESDLDTLIRFLEASRDDQDAYPEQVREWWNETLIEAAEERDRRAAEQAHLEEEVNSAIVSGPPAELIPDDEDER